MNGSSQSGVCSSVHAPCLPLVRSVCVAVDVGLIHAGVPPGHGSLGCPGCGGGSGGKGGLSSGGAMIIGCSVMSGIRCGGSFRLAGNLFGVVGGSFRPLDVGGVVGGMTASALGWLGSSLGKGVVGVGWLSSMVCCAGTKVIGVNGVGPVLVGESVTGPGTGRSCPVVCHWKRWLHCPGRALQTCPLESMYGQLWDLPQLPGHDRTW